VIVFEREGYEVTVANALSLKFYKLKSMLITVVRRLTMCNFRLITLWDYGSCS